MVCDSCLLTPLQHYGDRIRKVKVSKTHEFRERQFNSHIFLIAGNNKQKTQRERKVNPRKNRWCQRKHLLITTWPMATVSPCQPLPPTYIAKHDIMWYGVSLRSARVSCPICIPFYLLVSPKLTLWWGEEQRGLWCCVITAQQKLNCHYVTSVFSAQIQNITTLQATMKNFNSILPKTSTTV